MWTTEHYENFSDLPYDVQKAREESKRKAEADERLRGAVASMAPEPRAPVEDKRHALDVVRSHLSGITPAQREVWRREDYERRRAEHIRATSNTKPTDADIAAVNAEADRINAWLEAEYENEMEAEDDWNDD